MSESLSGKREGLQDNATRKKGKFIADSSQGSCHIQRSGVGSESPEPKLLHKFIGLAHAVGSWFKAISLVKTFAWAGLSPGVSAMFLIS